MYGGFIGMESLSVRLKHAMDARGLRSADLCRETGIAKSLISEYLSEARTPKQDKIYLLAKALNVNEGWLMGYDDEMPRRPRGNTPPTEFSDTDLKFALFGSIDIDDDVLADVRKIAKIHAELRRQQKEQSDEPPRNAVRHN
jgi:transcriptional regulator with XRE-family HTH domain